MQLTVQRLSFQDSWRDIVRVKKRYRLDRKGNRIQRGRICRVTVGDQSKWVIMHGRETDEAVIQMDLNVRTALDVKADHAYDFEFDQLSWFQSLWFPWKASDPGYRVAGQLGLISFILGTGLGAIGVLLGVFALKHN